MSTPTLYVILRMDTEVPTLPGCFVSISRKPADKPEGVRTHPVAFPTHFRHGTYYTKEITHNGHTYCILSAIDLKSEDWKLSYEEESFDEKYAKKCFHPPHADIYPDAIVARTMINVKGVVYPSIGYVDDASNEYTWYVLASVKLPVVSEKPTWAYAAEKENVPTV